MNDAVNGSQPKSKPEQLQLNPQQLGAVLLIDALLSQIQTTINQLGGFLGAKDAAEMVAHAGGVLGRDYMAMKDRWSKFVQLAPASAMSVIEGKKLG